MKIKYCESLLSERNIKTTIVALIFSSLCQQTGANVWQMYSNRIITNINLHVPPEKMVSANESTRFLGLIQIIASLLGFKVLKIFQAKKLILAGLLVNFLCLTSCSYFIQNQNGQMVVVCAVIFQISFYFSFGPINWTYLGEILSDVQFGVISTIHYLNGVEISIVTEYMVQYMGPSGMFIFYAFMNLLGFVFVYFYMRKTNGLTDK